VGGTLETASTRIGVRQTVPLAADRLRDSCYPSPAYLSAAPKGWSCGGMYVYPYGRLARSDQRERIAGILGIDAACTAKEPSGVALLAGSPVLWAS
jgi:hypothetical protein